MINLYQSYYEPSQIQSLSPDCIPFDNTRNESPELREYPLFKRLYEIEKHNDNLWGLLSWRFEEKTLLKPTKTVLSLTSSVKRSNISLNENTVFLLMPTCHSFNSL